MAETDNQNSSFNGQADNSRAFLFTHIHCITSYAPKDLTSQYTPDRIWQELGFGKECPTIMDVAERDPNARPLVIRTETHSRYYPNHNFFNFGRYYIRNLWTRCSFYRRLDPHELDFRLSLQSKVEGDQPMAMANRALPFNRDKLISYFWGHSIDMDYTSYHMIPFFISCLSDLDFDNLINGQGFQVNPPGYYICGLGWWIEHASAPGGIALPHDYYPILFRYVAVTDQAFPTYWQEMLAPFIDWNTTDLMIVMYQEDQLMQPPIQIAPPYPQGTPSARFFDYMLEEMTTHDRKQVLFGSPFMWYGNQSQNAAHGKGVFPDYIFDNHVMDFLAGRPKRAFPAIKTPNQFNGSSVFWCYRTKIALTVLIWQRLGQYYRRSWYDPQVYDVEAEQNLYYLHVPPDLTAAPGPDWHRRIVPSHICVFEFLNWATGTKFLMKPTDYTKVHMMEGNPPAVIYMAVKDGDHLQYPIGCRWVDAGGGNFILQAGDRLYCWDQNVGPILTSGDVQALIFDNQVAVYVPLYSPFSPSQLTLGPHPLLNIDNFHFMEFHHHNHAFRDNLLQDESPYPNVAAPQTAVLPRNF